MQKKVCYLLFTAVGAIAPMIAFFPWLVVHGFAPRLMVAELFTNRISTFFALDLVVTAWVVAVFARSELRNVKQIWLVIAVMLCIGVSAALPLLLFLREKESTGPAQGKSGY